tara:strand:- start:146 stop:349 length:204 start_codon:yes stop_codon:yes gene_type:complete
VKKYFYVSVVDGQRKGLAAGPYDTHQEALDKVGIVRDLIQYNNPDAWFWAYGTASTEDVRKTKLGVM